MRVKITTAPSIEPITKEEAKLQAHIDQSTEDSLVDYWIQTARTWAEQISRRAFITRTYTAYSDCWPWSCFELPYPPLIAVSSIKYYDDAGNPAVTISSSDYIVDAHSEPGRVALKTSASWPGVNLREINGFEVIYTAGYGTLASAVPAQYKAAMFLIVAHLFQHREGVVVEQGVSLAQLPMGVYDLLLTDRGGW